MNAQRKFVVTRDGQSRVSIGIGISEMLLSAIRSGSMANHGHRLSTVGSGVCGGTGRRCDVTTDHPHDQCSHAQVNCHTE